MDMSNLSKKSQERYEKIIKVGFNVFLKKGYEKASLTEIVKKSGGSLSTIYQHFGNKEGLFKAIIQRGINEFYDKIEFQLKDSYDDDLEDFLYKFGLIYAQIHVHKDVARFSRILYNEGYKQDAKIAHFFIDHIKNTIYKVLFDFLKQDRVKKQLKSDDLELIVFQFCLLIREPEVTNEIFFDKKLKLSQQEIKTKVKNIVEFFLRGYKKH